MTPRAGLVIKVAALPVAAATAAWTIHAIQDSPSPAASADVDRVPVVEVPRQELLPPVSVSAIKPAAKVVPTLAARPAGFAAEAAAGLIPEPALAAYQRSASVLADADKGCGLDWSLVAAIGRVESDHGRAGGNQLSAAGVATPGIYGVPLTGAAGTTRITDTDGGTYDRDTTYDRAVGPMQFIPSTWSEVGVDADSDGRRDPQDVDDAALAAAVYLCSGSADLSTDAGRREAVLRYNHSDAYVATVLKIADGYRLGQFEVPTGVVLPAEQIPETPDDLEPLSAATPGAQPPRRSAAGGSVPARPGGASSTPGGEGSTKPGGGSTTPSSPDPSDPEPGDGGSEDPSENPDPTQDPSENPDPTEDPTEDPGPSEQPDPTEDPDPTTPTEEPTPTPTDEPSETASAIPSDGTA
ncbi:transglycosylase protein with SLT domain [Nocardioides albertanoniae]|uniref:Transglycosylase protein with SLT domain n=1 Tax=Nocardioides albertanoniae TaxID=1175486 RepID=A0A543A2M0_9ACTN|nr:lytic transglycosylase domain-containing protein [Nocardioides albertanoniae]TQL66810.1 transglycosylase protein with SLT domain [Nocardioides albertanoniae]